MHYRHEKLFEAGEQAVGMPGFSGGQAAAPLLGIEILIVSEADNLIDPWSHFVRCRDLACLRRILLGHIKEETCLFERFG